MAVQREVWLNMIEQNLFDDLLTKVQGALKDDSAFIYSGGGVTTIHIPNAGTPASVTEGNTTYPVSTSERTDADNYYSLTNLEIGPIRVGWNETKQLSYDKEESVLNDNLQGLSLRAARNILNGQYHYTAGKYVVTTGASEVGHAPSATGNRKAFTAYDLKAALAIMDKQSVPANERALIIDSTMFWQLMNDLDFNADRLPVQPIGGLGSIDLYGVKIIPVVNAVFATAAGVVRAAGNAGAATDQAVALLLQKGCTSFGMSDIYANVSDNASGMFGNTYEASVMVGGKYRRSDKYGIIPIIQSNA